MSEYIDALYNRKADLLNAIDKAMSRVRATSATGRCADSIKLKEDKLVILFKDGSWMGFQSSGEGHEDSEINEMTDPPINLAASFVVPQLYADLKEVNKEIEQVREEANKKRNEVRDRLAYEQLKKRFEK